MKITVKPTDAQRKGWYGLKSLSSFSFGRCLLAFMPPSSIWWPVGSRDSIINPRSWGGLNCWCPPANSCSMASPLQLCTFIPKLKGEEWIKLLSFPQPALRGLFTGVQLSLQQLTAVPAQILLIFQLGFWGIFFPLFLFFPPFFFNARYHVPN